MTQEWPDSQLTRVIAELTNGQTDLRREVQTVQQGIDRLPDLLGEKFVLTKVHDLEVGELRTNQRSHGDRIDAHDEDLENIRGTMLTRTGARWAVGTITAAITAAASVLATYHR